MATPRTRPARRWSPTEPTVLPPTRTRKSAAEGAVIARAKAKRTEARVRALAPRAAPRTRHAPTAQVTAREAPAARLARHAFTAQVRALGPPPGPPARHPSTAQVRALGPRPGPPARHPFTAQAAA